MTPSIMRALVRWLAPADVRDTLVDDLDEAYARERKTRSAAGVRLWCWRQALSSVAPLVRMRLRGGARFTETRSRKMSLETVLQDLRYAIRLLRRAPAFTFAAVATLALGLGVNTAVFSVVHSLLLKPLPYPQADRLVTVWQDMRARGGPVDEWATPGNLADWRAEQSVFASMASIRAIQPTLTGLGDPQPIAGEQVTGDYFGVLGVTPELGRLFHPEELVPNGPRVVILSHNTWMRRFGGDPHVLGQRIALGGEPHEVIGVLGESFRPVIISAAEFWRPDRLNLVAPLRGAVVLRVVARLQPGVTVPRALTAMDALSRQLAARYPATNVNAGINVVPLQEQVVGNVRPGLVVLSSAVALVLLIACVNIANLLLARGSGRTREMAVRSALGAGRARVVRQLLTESFVLAVVGGALGTSASVWGVKALVAIAPAGTPRLDEIGVDPSVLVYAGVLTLVTGAAFGLVPAWQSARRQDAAGLQDGSRGSTAASGQRTRRALIVAEVALALVLLFGGGLLLRSFLALERTDLGFNPSGLLTGFVSVPGTKYRTDAEKTVFQDRLIERVAAIPGVTHAAVTSVLPLGGDSDMNFLPEGMPMPATEDQAPVTWYRVVSGDYFETMGVPLVKGRTFSGREAAPVVVVNEALVAKYWPGQDALGRRIRFSNDATQPWFTIIGVVADVKQRGARGAPRVQSFLPYWHFPELAGGTNVVLRASVPPETLSASLGRAVREVDAELPVSQVTPMASLVSASIDQPRFLALITGVFAGLAALLAAVGVYGVMSYSVTARLPEIGVRLALGARRADVFRLVFASGLRLAVMGLVIGGAVALFVAPTMSTVLFGVGPADPLTFVLTAGALLVVASVATLLPSRRATRVDPAVALRE
jgi:putative ABC transport system permease protein